MADADKRQELASKVLSMSSGMKDSDEMWRDECHTLIGSMRYFEDPPSYRCATPQSDCLFVRVHVHTIITRQYIHYFPTPT